MDINELRLTDEEICEAIGYTWIPPHLEHERLLVAAQFKKLVKLMTELSDWDNSN
jgi:hypothetical protein